MQKMRKIIYKIIKHTKNKKEATIFYLTPYLKIVEKQLASSIAPPKNTRNNYIWTMWLQDEVPEIIQFCINSILKIYPETIILTEKNIEEYITIPDFIKEKYNKKIISHPHYSDYIRCMLLETYGGLWIDASCYLLDKVPEFITEQDFFILTGPAKKSISNFFLYAKQNNYLIKAIRIFLEEYWKREKFTADYFFFHIFFMLLCQKNTKCKECFDKMQPWANTQVRYLTDYPELDFNPKLWDYLKKTSFMYKINRKNQTAMTNKNGFYHYFLNNAKNS